MKRQKQSGARRAFRLEWEGAGSSGKVYLYGVGSFGEYTDQCKRFVTSAGSVSVFGKRLTVSTYRSGCVEVSGAILGVSLDPDRKGEKEVADD